MIATEHLCKRYGRYEAVRDVSLSIGRGQVSGLLGLNGAGKTTVLRMLAGLLRPTSGRVRIGGKAVWGSGLNPALARGVGVVSQELCFHEQASVRSLIDFYAALAGVDPAQGYELAEALEVPLERPACLLSPGQQRKAQMAMVLLKEPQVLFLDEPWAGLDPWGLAGLRRVLRRQAARDTTILLSSHILAEVRELCQEVAILHEGEIRYCGPAGSDLEGAFMQCIGRQYDVAAA